MSEARILVVEDDDKIADVLSDYLAYAGYEVRRLARGDEVEPWLAAKVSGGGTAAGWGDAKKMAGDTPRPFP